MRLLLTAFVAAAGVSCSAQREGAGAAEASDRAASAGAGVKEEVRIATSVGEVHFRNSPKCDQPDCLRHSIVRQLNDRYVFVRSKGAAGETVFSVDRVGGEVRVVHGLPHLSPMGSAFITTAFDEMAGSPATNGTFVWTFGDDGALLLSAHVPVTRLADPRFVRWLDEECADLSGVAGWGTARQIPGVSLSVRKTPTAAWEPFDGSCAQRRN